MAAEIKKAYPDADIELQRSRGGRFEVMLDGTPIYEKSKTGRHAKPGEVLGLIRESREQGIGNREPGRNNN